MNILDRIIKYKKVELQEKKELFPVKGLEKSIYFETPVVSLSKYLLRKDKWGIIAEIKRKSPSKGMIHEFADIEKISIGYMQAGASAISVLTDEHFFGGSSKYLTQARHFNYCPILRKDFIFDEYQIIEAKSIGADAILLIASVLSVEQTKQLAEFATRLGLEVLLEVHTKEEAQNYPNEFTKLVGVNNRNLDDFSVSLNISMDLSKIIPDEFVKVSESGINDPQSIIQLKEYGFAGFLIGENFMQSANPHLKCAKFIKSLKSLEEKK
jgi:indole-3-glycerol phosphate synthase